MKPSLLALILIATTLLTGCQQHATRDTRRTVSGGPPSDHKSVLGEDLKRAFERRGYTFQPGEMKRVKDEAEAAKKTP